MNAKKWMQYIGLFGLLVMTSMAFAALESSKKQNEAQSKVIKEDKLTNNYTSIQFHFPVLNEQRRVLIHLPDEYLPLNKATPSPIY